MFLPFIGTLASTQDTIYVMRSGTVVYKKAITDIDSISFENTIFNRRSIVNKIATDKSFSIFYQGLVATGLVDSLKADRDKNYDYNYYRYLITDPNNSYFYNEVPRMRRYGYTLLIESDAVFNMQGISSLSELKSYAAQVYNSVYPEDASITDVTNRKNSLNRFIAYHIINKKLSLNMFIDAYDTDHMIKSIDMYEYLEPMCPNSLIEIKKERITGRTNLINQLNENGNSIQIIPGNADKDIYNGFFYGIDKILSFDSATVNYLSNKRLRFDISSLFPELSNNGIRAAVGIINKNLQFIIPTGYLDRLKTNDQNKVSYLTPDNGFMDFEGDEISISPRNGGNYEFTITTPPIPSGIYEVRFGYQANMYRGVAEFYIDDMPAGLPVNLNLNGLDTEIGYVLLKSYFNDPLGYENDKMMRNHGYMKAPACFTAPTFYTGESARFSNSALRKILGTFTFNTAGSHKLLVKGLSSGVFMYDYIEFVPVSALENEDIN